MEREWEQLMVQSHILKKHGGYSLFEMKNMTAEERKWVINRIDRENKDQQDAEKSAMNSARK
jgi:hypothetical protein